MCLRVCIGFSAAALLSYYYVTSRRDDEVRTAVRITSENAIRCRSHQRVAVVYTRTHARTLARSAGGSGDLYAQALCIHDTPAKTVLIEIVFENRPAARRAKSRPTHSAAETRRRRRRRRRRRPCHRFIYYSVTDANAPAFMHVIRYFTMCSRVYNTHTYSYTPIVCVYILLHLYRIIVVFDNRRRPRSDCRRRHSTPVQVGMCGQKDGCVHARTPPQVRTIHDELIIRAHTRFDSSRLIRFAAPLYT